jgi:hypothetical protein
MNKSICFAYYADGSFIGWYADSFGSVRPTPKIYSDSIKQIEIISSNFRNKIKRISEESVSDVMDKFRAEEGSLLALEETDEIIRKKNALGISTLAKYAIHDSEDLLRGKNIELRIVECPEYDGINPDFDKEAYDKLAAEYRKRMEEAGIFDIPAPSIERLDAIKKFESENPRPIRNSWIYADFNKVKAWAANEPTEFIGTIKAN